VIAGAIGGWKKRAMALLLCRPPLQQHPQGCSRGSLIYDVPRCYLVPLKSRQNISVKKAATSLSVTSS